ncbi:MAG: biotin/lipoyl-binding protein, partial [Synechococcaceae bacterium WB9_4xC_028]|nr:biotin/lipoyl-binding protein [Synechococcaceae bacterium WB9_4xC_028]
MNRPNPIGGLIRKVQDQLEKRADSLSHNDSVLQQDRLWLRSVTWALVGTTALGLGWLAIARTEEVVVAQGKLEPVGNVKDLQIPAGGVVKAILVKGGERVTKGQVLIELDQKSSNQELKSLQESKRQKQQQLTQKQQQLLLKQQEKARSAEINREQISSLQARLALEEKILSRLTTLAKEGASSELQYLQQQNKVEELRGSVSKEIVEGRRQTSVLNQQIEQINSETAGLRSDLAQLRAQITQAEVTLGYQSLRAPVDGVVFDLKLTTPGFVAQTGEP